MSNLPQFKPFDPQDIAQNHLNFPISEVQPLYFVAESFEKAKHQIIDYCEQINKPFNLSYNKETDSIEVDRAIRTREEIDDSQESSMGGSMA